MMQFPLRRRGVGLFLALALIVVAGCSKSAGTAVKGQVSYNGAPVSGASLIFYPATGRAVTAVIDADGSYTANLPPGDYAATVNIGVELPPGWKEGQPIPPAKINLPPQYSKRAQSPLKATIAEGSEQTVHFDLK